MRGNNPFYYMDGFFLLSPNYSYYNRYRYIINLVFYLQIVNIEGIIFKSQNNCSGLFNGFVIRFSIYF